MSFALRPRARGQRALCEGEGMATRRQAWAEVDAGLRADVEALLGAPVVAAESQPGGFSPGSADRVRLADGRRAFVKTGTDAVNPDVVGIHRREAAISALLPPEIPAPRFLGVVDHGDRIALILEDVEARHPHTPWVRDELVAVLGALGSVAERPVPAAEAIVDMATVAGHYGSGWSRIDRVPSLPGTLPGWVAERLPWLRDEGLRMPDAVAGDRLVHHDVRADNVLLRPDGSVVLIDWPWAARGAGWLDALTLLFNVRYLDPEADVEAVVAEHPVFAGMPALDADRVLIGIAGHFLAVSQEPDVPGIPTLRAFQYDQAVAILGWLQERLG